LTTRRDSSRKASLWARRRRRRPGNVTQRTAGQGTAGPSHILAGKPLPMHMKAVLPQNRV
jgi:hypothetical protein